jgi:hypothetical protein
VGFVLNPDGSPVPGACVHISLTDDYTIRTDTNGLCDTRVKPPAGGYAISATNPVSGLIGRAERDGEALRSRPLGPQFADIVVQPYPSDHRAVVATVVFP